ncbi:MAG: hypothetical protein WC784_02710 [Candidatus Shapirobacteria bacterium]|jgi:hypothetical protein
MSETKIKKGVFKWIHLETIAVLVGYFLVSNFILVKSLAHANVYVSFLVPLIFGVGSSWTFLYLFSHQDFWHFIKNLADQEKKQENKYLGKFKHYGKIFTCILISAFGGPIFLALTTRFLFSEKENRYLIVTASNIVSTLLIVAVAKGFLGIFY